MLWGFPAVELPTCTRVGFFCALPGIGGAPENADLAAFYAMHGGPVSYVVLSTCLGSLSMVMRTSSGMIMIS